MNRTDSKLACNYPRLSRKQEVRETFAALDKGERRGQRPASSQDSLGYVDDLIAVLSRLGPVFSHFGRYLGSRPDSFRLEHCLRLRETGSVTMLSAEALRTYFAELFPKFMPPWILNLREDLGRSDHLIHVYRWGTQREISFRLVNPKFADAWPADRLLLPVVEQPSQRLWPSVPVRQIICQFERCVERDLNLKREIECLDYLESHESQRPSTDPRFVLPEIADEFCSPGILAIREPQAAPDSQPLHKPMYEEAAGEVSGPTPAQLDGTRLLCLTWLHNALKFSWFPETPKIDNLTFLATRHIACLGGPLTSLQRDIQDALYQYLGAVTSNRPDEAAALLVTIFQRRKNAADFETVRDHFRQVVPFRDGGWDRIGQRESFAEYVFIQWRIASESGYDAPEELISFVKSFWEVALICHTVAPERDVLRDALDEFRWIHTFEKLRGLFTASNLARQSQDWITLVMEMPEMLNGVARNQVSPATPSRTLKTESQSSPQWLVLAAHAFVLGAIGALLVKLAEARANDQTLFLAGIGAFVAIGFSLLRSVRRNK